MSGRANWMFCDDICDLEDYWNEYYESNKQWRDFVDKKMKKQVPPPQIIFRLTREHFNNLVIFLNDALALVDNQDDEYRSLNHFSRTGNELKRRILENIMIRKHAKQLSILKNTNDFRISNVFSKSQFNHVSRSFKVQMNAIDYVMFLLYDLNYGGIGLVPFDCKDEVIFFHLGFSLFCPTMYGYFFETLEKGKLEKRVINLNPNDKIALEEYIKKYNTSHFFKFDQKYCLEKFMKMVAFGEENFDEDFKLVLNLNEEIFNYLLDKRKKDHLNCYYDLSFSFK